VIDDRRAVSSVVSYTLLVGITLVLTTGLILGTGSVVEQQRERTAQSQLQIVAERFSDTLTTADRLVRGTETAPDTVALTRRFPARVAGTGYTLAVTTGGSGPRLRIEANDLDATVTVPLRVETDLAETRVNGGTVRVVYDPTASPPQLEVHDG
jgi:FlaG/FlaF family flagellin (archaellin)